MAEKLIFKRGLLANLPATATDGTIYMTTDEGGIYLGLADGAMKRMGDYITVANVAALNALTATPGHKISENALYYATAENILCRWSGTAWVQINKQATASALIGGTKVNATSTGFEVEVLDKNSNKVGTAGSMTIEGSGATTVSKKTGTDANGLVISSKDTKGALSVASNVIKLTNTAAGETGAAAGQVTIAAGGNMGASVGTSNNTITVNVNAPKVAKTITGSTADNTATISTSLNTSQGNAITGTGASHKIKGSGGIEVSVSQDAPDTIVINAPSVLEHQLAVANNTVTLNVGGQAKGTATIAAAGNLGAAVSTEGNTIKMTVNSPKVSAAFNASGALTVGLEDNGGNTIANTSASITPTVEYGAGAVKSSAKFVSGKMTLDVHTKDEVLALLKNINAMVFKGAMSANNIKLITTAQNGDTYKVSAGGNVSATSTVTAQTGDLVINTAADDAAPSWTVIPSGDETVLMYKLSGTGNSIDVVDQNGNKQSGSVTISGGTKITIANGAINHNTATIDTTAATNGSLSLIGQQAISFSGYDTVSADATGHLTAAKKKTYTINPLSSAGLTAAGVANGFKLTSSVAAVGGQTLSGAVNITSQSLKLASTTAGAATIDLEWGTF